MRKCFLVIAFMTYCFCYGQNERLDLEKDILTWDKVETENLVFYYQPNSAVTDKDNFAVARENAFKTINATFNSKLPKKITMIVWNSDVDAKKYGIPPLGFAISRKCVVFTRYNQTRGHEITHVISFYVSDKQIQNGFINEGIATAFSLDNYNKLEAAKKMKEKSHYTEAVSLRDAWNSPSKYPEWVNYLVSSELIRKLIDEHGNEKFLQLVVNQTYENAKSIYGTSLETIIDELEKQIN